MTPFLLRYNRVSLVKIQKKRGIHNSYCDCSMSLVYYEQILHSEPVPIRKVCALRNEKILL